MSERGVTVSFNSDSSELARRMNLEAAKAVRYGGLGETEALELVTLNPAIQLGIAERVGSLEPGKDADFVVWSGSPLSTTSIVEQTWVDGRRYFDRQADLDRRAVIAAEREMLLKKVRSQKVLEDAGEPDAAGEAPEAGTPEPEVPQTDEPETPELPEEPEPPVESEEPELPEEPQEPAEPPAAGDTP